MRTGGRDPIQGFADGGRLAHHDKVVRGLEQRPEPGPNDLMIIEKEDPDTQRSLLGRQPSIRANR